MSATLFCPSCGTKNESINGKKANFCCSCGTNLQSLAAFGAKPAPVARPASRPGVTPALDISYSNDESTEEGTEEIGFSKNDIQIELPQDNTLKVKDLLGTASTGHDGARQPLDTKAKKRASGKATFASFKDEAGAGPVKRIEIG